MVEQKNVVVIGGGIAGLSAAYYLQQLSAASGQPLTIRLYEKDPSPGGKIQTERRDGFVIEGGPDTFVISKPWGMSLCRALGLDDRLQGTNPAYKKTYILHEDRLHPLPGGLTMMIPTEFLPMISTRLLSWAAKLRMGLDYLIPANRRLADETMGDFVSRRLGRQAYERLVEPLMSGIYAGDGDRLSVMATLPYLRELEIKHGGLVRGALALRRSRSSNGHGGPGSRTLFQTPLSGLAEITEALINELQTAGVELHCGIALEQIELQDGEPRLHFSDGSTLVPEAAILATPAFDSAAAIGDAAPHLAELLEAIEYVSTATVTMAYAEDQLKRPLDGYGYVIPRREGRKALACTWTSTKFPHRAPEGYALLRVFIGRAGQGDEITWTDAELIKTAREELRRTMGIVSDPIFSRVSIFERGMPQYNLGHPERLEQIEIELQSHPWLSLAGASLRGIGIPDCIRSGELAAQRTLERLSNLENTQPSADRSGRAGRIK